jgi:3-deoxy-D-manno-octulosonic-acid transferase
VLRKLYTSLWLAALPFLPARLWWRGRREPLYRKHIGERFGRNLPAARSPVLWIHAVSLGETRAAAPLIERLQRHYPHATLLLTHMTTTGRAAAQAVTRDRVVQAWLPYDVPFAVRAFLQHFRPRAGMIMETELWPNLIAEAKRAGIPMFLVNARLSPKSAVGYARVERLTRPMLQSLAGVAAQTDPDAARLHILGAPAPAVTGNLKFDVAIPPAASAVGNTLRRRFGESRPIWVVGSTRDGEEALILDALVSHPLPTDVITVIVPRHPQRFPAVAMLLRQRGLAYVSRSENRAVPSDVRFVLGDSMGEMSAYYSAADVVFVGGSLVPTGGQNLIESIAAGKPTIVGPHMFNFAEATENALAAGAVLQVADAKALIDLVAALLADPARRHALGDVARAFHAVHRGAADRLWEWLAPQLAALELSREGRD